MAPRLLAIPRLKAAASAFRAHRDCITRGAAAAATLIGDAGLLIPRRRD